MNKTDEFAVSVSPEPAPPPVCLLAEDEAFLATLLEVELAEAGIDVAGPFKRVEDALAWLENATPDIAVIDTMLADGSTHALALALKDRAVGFIVHSGSDPGPGGIHPAFTDAPWLTKPMLPGSIVEEVWRQLKLARPEPNP